jgi:FKBP-type peptidyl-prolyl cis-trans isomerase FklB
MMFFIKAKKPIPPSAIPVPVNAILKSTFDSASYFFGMNVGKNLVKQQLNKINLTLLGRALDEEYRKKTTLLAGPIENFILQQHYQSIAPKQKVTITPKTPAINPGNDKIAAEKAKGAVFLAENKKRKEIISTGSGLQYEVLKRGDSSSATPTMTDKFVVHYVGSLIDGTVFESSIKNGQPLTMGVNQVIGGWKEALQLMHIGDKFKIYLPSDIGYGDSGNGGSIPGGAVLIFEMELLNIIK